MISPSHDLTAAPKTNKCGKQIKHADRRQILHAWFGTDQVKDIRTGEQVQADAASWMPVAQDLVR